MTQVLNPPLADPDALVASGLGPNVAIDPRPLEAAPPLVSLLSSAPDITAELEAKYGRHWINGIAFEPEGGALDLVNDYPYFWSCPPDVAANPSRAWAEQSPGGVKQIPTAPDDVTYTPWTAHTADPCISTFGMFGRDGRGRARRLLEANLSRILENELWTGTRAQAAGFPNDYLMNGPTILAGTMGHVSALVDLEQAYFELDNRPGMLHAQPRLVELWVRNGMVKPSPSGRQLLTNLGTTVVPGSGYPGTGTGLAAATHTNSFAYITGMVVVARTPVTDQTEDEAEMVYSSTNTRNVRAEADVAAFWDGKVNVAVQVTHLTELA